MDEAEAEVFVIYDDNCNWKQCQFYCPSVQGQWLQLLRYGSNNNVKFYCFNGRLSKLDGELSMLTVQKLRWRYEQDVPWRSERCVKRFMMGCKSIICSLFEVVVSEVFVKDDKWICLYLFSILASVQFLSRNIDWHVYLLNAHLFMK